MRPRHVVCLAASLVACLVGAARAAADGGASTCVATGLLAVLPDVGTLSPVGPELAGPTKTGASAAATADQATGLTADPVELGVAGCVDAQGTPGGTTLRAGSWSVLGGAVSGTSLRVDLVPAPADGSGWRPRVRVGGLLVEGRPADLRPGETVPVGDVAELTADPSLSAAPAGLRYRRAAFELRLLRRYGTLSAGTTLVVGWIAADRPSAPAPAPAPATTTTTTTASAAPTPPPAPVAKPKPNTKNAAVARHPVHRTRPAAHAARPHAARRHAVRRRHAQRRHRRTRPAGPQPLRVTPPLGSTAYTFPVAGTVSWGDSYGGERSDVPGGWHHGDDLFVPLGTPVVAVADGTVFAVGWNPVGGWRLWLRDARGNQFYYAHLSGYTALARNDRHVERGQVLGFAGNTGDAVTTPPHVHFEIHPDALLYLGYNGAVDPTSYLAGWARPGRVAVPPPVPLPSRPPAGHGAARDFRELLAQRPLRPTRGTPGAPPRPAKSPPLGPVDAVAARRRPTARSGDGAALAAAIVLLAAALAAAALGVRHAVRFGRAG